MSVRYVNKKPSCRYDSRPATVLSYSRLCSNAIIAKFIASRAVFAILDSKRIGVAT